MKRECADSIRARDYTRSHPKAGYMEAIFLYVTNAENQGNRAVAE